MNCGDNETSAAEPLTGNGQAQGPAALLLSCFRRVLFVGLQQDPLAEYLTSRGIQVQILSEDAPPSGCFDAVLLGDLTHVVDDPAAGLVTALPCLSAHGAVYLTVPGSLAAVPMLSGAGLRPYLSWTADAQGRLTGEAAIEESDPAVVARVVMAVHEHYDPVAHARALFKEGHPDWGLEVLSNIPEPFLIDPETRSLVAAERQLCILSWDRASGPEGRLARFFRAQREFYVATTLLPRRREPYLVQAAFWKAIGDADMGARLLRSVDYAIADTETRRKRASGRAKQSPLENEEAVPEWWPPPSPPRILIISHEESDFGMDTLYDGLCRVIGPENVVEFPWKPTLHGRSPEKTYGYPCLFDYPGTPLSLEEVCGQLREGRFDVVCFVDTLRTLAPSVVTPLVEAMGCLPLFIIDTWDEGGDYYADTLGHLGRETAQAYFKREMLACGDYPPDTYPLPFAYPDGLLPTMIEWDRPDPVFWAGKRMCGLRSLYLDHLETVFGMTFDKTYDQDTYIQTLHRSRIGLNFFGLGFDTVRYWELPAHGCMLLAERPPIRIPHDFRDGESAVFFDDLPDLEEKLRYYMAHAEETRAIAQAGHEHFKRYHTGSARARQFLGRIQGLLR